jgi:DNA-binding CsgD family transcriptional regulator
VDVRTALDRTRAAEARSVGGFTFAIAPLIDILLERGELEEASRLVDKYSQGELPGLFQVVYLLDSIGRLRIAQRQIDDGIKNLRECGRRIKSWGVNNPGLVPWRSSVAPALAATGERDEARALVHKEIGLARGYDVPRELGMALRAAGLVERGDNGLDLLREAVAVLETSPARLEHARALADLGAALRRANHNAAAREPLRKSLDLARRSGATELAGWAHRELVAAGARPRRLVVTGIDALTASERRVAGMAAERMSNRQIAQALFVTEKTVEGHLAQVYRKLDISTRTQLPTALGRDPAAT